MWTTPEPRRKTTQAPRQAPEIRQSVRLGPHGGPVQSIFLILRRNKRRLGILSARSASILRLPMKTLVDHIVAHRAGALAFLVVAAFLEAYGDSCFQSGLYRSSGMSRWLAFAGGAVSLAAYGLVVNGPRWDFGKLLGVYVVLFFLLAQVVARVRFGQTPTLPILAGGGLIVAGGVVITAFGGR